MNTEQSGAETMGAAPNRKMPALFVGHGSPMNAIEDNQYVRAWRELGASLSKPAAILSISAHWLTEGTYVHTSSRPKTIHDFWGFPEELYRIDYDCPGAPMLAREVMSLVSGTVVKADSEWGIDHGTWAPLRHLFPGADIPTCQLSIDISKPSRFHYDLGAQLTPLRERGVLIIGSGNIVHNLGRISFDPEAQPYDWAVEFDELAAKCIEAGDHESLIAYKNLGEAASLSVPTPDHYWPLLYTLGVQGKDERISFPVEGLAHGSISMRAILIS